MIAVSADTPPLEGDEYYSFSGHISFSIKLYTQFFRECRDPPERRIPRYARLLDLTNVYVMPVLSYSQRHFGTVCHFTKAFPGVPTVSLVLFNPNFSFDGTKNEK